MNKICVNTGLTGSDHASLGCHVGHQEQKAAHPITLRFQRRLDERRGKYPSAKSSVEAQPGNGVLARDAGPISRVMHFAQRQQDRWIRIPLRRDFSQQQGADTTPPYLDADDEVRQKKHTAASMSGGYQTTQYLAFPSESDGGQHFAVISEPTGEPLKSSQLIGIESGRQHLVVKARQERLIKVLVKVVESHTFTG